MADLVSCSWRSEV